MLSDEQKSQIYRWWELFKQGKKLVEIRIIGDKKTFSGYYKNIENLIRDVEQHTDCNVYFTIGNLEEAVYGRPQCESLKQNVKNSTTDAEVISRDFVFLDFDCAHAGVAGINSTDAEKKLAHRKAVDVYRFLIDNGFNNSIIPVDSGNGTHLYIPCRLKGSPENDEMIKRFTLALSMLFSDENVKIDEKIFNRGRIAKLPGTYSRKGSPLNMERPQRMCRILKTPDEIIPNENEYFQKIADLYPAEPEKPSYSNNFNTSKFDLDEFLNKHDIKVTKIENVAGGKKYVLEHCVFNDQHRNKDAVIFKSDSGAISYVCLHNSCSHYSWRDVRLKFEPDAYSKKDIAEFIHKQRYYGNFYREPFVPKPETDELGKKWISAGEVERVDTSKLTAANTGYPELDRAMWGLFMGDVTVVTGTSGSGKSSWLNCVLANMVEHNVNVGIWSGELPSWKLMGWLYCTFAGKSYTEKKIGYDNWYITPKNICDKIDVWLGRKLLIYNNLYGNNFAQLFSDIKETIDRDQRQVIVVDNLAALDLSEYAGKDLEKQTKFITDLKNLAQTKNIHIIVVIHPRKLGSEMARKEMVSGSNNLTNLVDNVVIVSRQGLDFQKRITEFLGEQKAQEYFQYDTILELAKSRMSGVQDKFIGLYFEPESRRIKNSVAEHIVYGWASEPTQQAFSFPPIYEPQSSSNSDWLTPIDEENVPF